MIANTGDKLDPVRELYKIIVGAYEEGIRLGHCLFFAGQDYERHILQFLVGPEEFYEGESVYFRHYEVLKYYCRGDLHSHFNRLGRVFAVVKDDVLLRGQHSSYRFSDNRLIVYQEDCNGMVYGWACKLFVFVYGHRYQFLL